MPNHDGHRGCWCDIAFDPGVVEFAPDEIDNDGYLLNRQYGDRWWEVDEPDVPDQTTA